MDMLKKICLAAAIRAVIAAMMTEPPDNMEMLTN
jgi:hypothetical protein